jgi:hypothetical protein
VLSPTKDHLLSPSPTKETLLSDRCSPTNNEEENDYGLDYIDDEGIQINTYVCISVCIDMYLSKHTNSNTYMTTHIRIRIFVFILHIKFKFNWTIYTYLFRKHFSGPFPGDGGGGGILSRASHGARGTLRCHHQVTLTLTLPVILTYPSMHIL